MTDRNANRKGYKKTLVGWIPEEWGCSRVDEVCKLVSGGTPDTTVSEYWNGRIPWVTTSEITYSVIAETAQTITEKGLKKSAARILPRGALIMAMYGQGATRGRVAILGCEAATNQACVAITPTTKCASQYLFQRFTHDYMRLRNLSQGGGQQNLSIELIGWMQIPIPSLTEQKKIAEILSTWDDAIEQVRALIAAAKRRKKALMQQLLTGRKRLPGFGSGGGQARRPPEGWSDVKIGALFEEVERPVTWDDDATYSLLSVRRASGGAFLREHKKGKDILTKGMFIAKVGDFLISKMQVLHGAMALVPSDLDGTHISGSYIVLRPKDRAAIDPQYFTMLSATSAFYRLAYISSYGVHIEKMTFNLEWFLESVIRIPADLNEQRAIAAVLATADEEIKSLEAKGAALESQKKGLMQKLLTGEVRVGC